MSTYNKLRTILGFYRRACWVVSNKISSTFSRQAENSFSSDAIIWSESSVPYQSIRETSTDEYGYLIQNVPKSWRNGFDLDVYSDME